MPRRLVIGRDRDRVGDEARDGEGADGLGDGEHAGTEIVEASADLAIGTDQRGRRPGRAAVDVAVACLVAALLVLLAQTTSVPAGAHAVTRSSSGLAEKVPDDGEPAPEPFRPAADPTASTAEAAPPSMVIAGALPAATTALLPDGSSAPAAGPPPAPSPTLPRATGAAGSAGEGVSREVPTTAVEVASAPAAPGPWAAVTRTTPAGYVATDVGCAAGTSAAQLDAFFSGRLGPVIGEDYQHVTPLGGGRHLWIFQDTFIDPAGTATRLDQASFVHNVALVQDGACFTLHHRGTDLRPSSFEPGTGERTLATWFWPMGGELVGGQIVQFWVEMQRDGYTPGPVDGLGWHPVRTWIGAYDARTLQRLSFAPAPDDGVAPVYGYAIATQGEHTYLFGNTFEQNLVREGGYANGPHSATAMYLARVPAGEFGNPPEYRTADGWSADPAAATPIVQRFWAENPMQPRFVGGQWAAVAKVDGYWGEELAVDVAAEPWGPWTTVERRPVLPRAADPLMNTYHAHLMPWLEGGQLVVSISQNARNMVRDAYPVPSRYRIALFRTALVAPPAVETTTTGEVATTAPDTSTTAEPTSTTAESTTTAEPTTTASSTTAAPSTSASEPTTTAASSTTDAASTTSVVAPTTAPAAPPSSTSASSTGPEPSTTPWATSSSTSVPD